MKGEVIVHYCHKELRKESELVSQEKRKRKKTRLMNELFKDGASKQGTIEFEELLTNLKLLEEWCEKKKTDEHTKFFAFFQNATIGAYYRYMWTKQKAWSWKRNASNVVLTVLLPAISTVGMQVLTEYVLPLITSEGTVSGDENTMTSKLLVGGVIGLSWMIAYLYREMSENRQYKETWVRHSICYSRLHVALSAFVVSMQTDRDYEKLVKDTFEILNQNLDQFALNLSSNGMASRD